MSQFELGLAWARFNVPFDTL